jgi:hypothetical protein
VLEVQAHPKVREGAGGPIDDCEKADDVVGTEQPRYTDGNGGVIQVYGNGDGKLHSALPLTEKEEGCL